MFLNIYSLHIFINHIFIKLIWILILYKEVVQNIKSIVVLILKLKGQNPICYFTERGILFTELQVY